MSWVVFGSNGHDKRPVESVPIAFPNMIYESTIIKSIVQPEYVVPFVINPHFFYFDSGKFCVNEDKFPVYGSVSYHSSDTIQVNHYEFMSREDYENKVKRGCADQIKSDPKKKINSMDKFYAQWENKGVPDESIDIHMNNFLMLKSLEVNDLKKIVSRRFPHSIHKCIAEIESLILAGKFATAFKLFKSVKMYYETSPEICHIGVILYVANGEIEEAESFLRDYYVKCMSTYSDKNKNYIKISTVLDSIALYFSQLKQYDKEKAMRFWLEYQEKNFKNGENSVFDQFAWVKESQKHIVR